MTVKNLYPSFQNPYLIKPARPIPKEMAVVGSGTIGPDIAYGFRTAFPDMKLYLVDVVEEPLKKARRGLKDTPKRAWREKRSRPEQVEKILGNIVYTTDYSQLKNCELVIEAATENLDLKKKILSQIESVVAKDAIITSNTSGILAHQIFSHLNNPERTTNTHFFEPAWRSMGVEVINWEKTNPETVNWLLWFFAQAGKAPIAAQDAFSFVLNRLFETWGSETAWMLQKATSKEIDFISEEFLGAGPFGIMTNPLTYSSMMRRTAEGACLYSFQAALVRRQMGLQQAPHQGRRGSRDCRVDPDALPRMRLLPGFRYRRQKYRHKQRS